MSQEPRPDYDQLPPSVPLSDTVAHQGQDDDRYNAGGAGDAVGAVPDGADGD